MKKIWLILGLIMTIFLVSGCNKAPEVAKGGLPSELVDKEWLFLDEVTGESHVLNFFSNGSYSYHCRCGEPIGDSDVFEYYGYDEDRNVIILSNSYDNSTSEIEVIRYNEYHLMVRIDGKLRDFNSTEFDTTSNFYWMEGEQYFSGYHSFSTITEISEDSITCAPIGYDPQGLYADGPFEEYKLADSVEYSELSITSWCTANDGLVNEDHYEKEEAVLTETEAAEMMENGSSTAFLWFNEDMEIVKILFWGQTTIIE